MVTFRKNGKWIDEPKDDPIRDSRQCVADVTDKIVDSINKLKEIEKFNSNDSFRNQFQEKYNKVLEKMESLKDDLKDYDNMLYEKEQILWKYLSEPTML
jgi:uncharacterized protein (UPF0305 family)